MAFPRTSSEKESETGREDLVYLSGVLVGVEDYNP
jgi:hypothetical protein